MNILLQLNLTIRDNYCFMDSEAPLCLNMNNPRGFAPRLTGSILSGLRYKTLIDVNNVVDLNTGKLRVFNAPVQPEQAGEPKSPIVSTIPQNGAQETVAPIVAQQELTPILTIEEQLAAIAKEIEAETVVEPIVEVAKKIIVKKVAPVEIPVVAPVAETPVK